MKYIFSISIILLLLTQIACEKELFSLSAPTIAKIEKAQDQFSSHLWIHLGQLERGLDRDLDKVSYLRQQYGYRDSIALNMKESGDLEYILLRLMELKDYVAVHRKYEDELASKKAFVPNRFDKNEYTFEQIWDANGLRRLSRKVDSLYDFWWGEFLPKSWIYYELADLDLANHTNNSLPHYIYDKLNKEYNSEENKDKGAYRRLRGTTGFLSEPNFAWCKEASLLIQKFIAQPKRHPFLEGVSFWKFGLAYLNSFLSKNLNLPIDKQIRQKRLDQNVINEVDEGIESGHYNAYLLKRLDIQNIPVSSLDTIYRKSTYTDSHTPIAANQNWYIQVYHLREDMVLLEATYWSLGFENDYAATYNGFNIPNHLISVDGFPFRKYQLYRKKVYKVLHTKTKNEQWKDPRLLFIANSIYMNNSMWDIERANELNEKVKEIKEIYDFDNFVKYSPRSFQTISDLESLYMGGNMLYQKQKVNQLFSFDKTELGQHLKNQLFENQDTVLKDLELGGYTQNSNTKIQFPLMTKEDTNSYEEIITRLYAKLDTSRSDSSQWNFLQNPNLKRLVGINLKAYVYAKNDSSLLDSAYQVKSQLVWSKINKVEKTLDELGIPTRASYLNVHDDKVYVPKAYAFASKTEDLDFFEQDCRAVKPEEEDLYRIDLILFLR